MEARDLNNKLLENFPELTKELNSYIDDEEGLDTGAFLTYEDVFRRHIETAIRIQDKGFLERVGNFLETLIISDDEYTVNVVTVAILEGLKAYCSEDEIKSFLQPKCLKTYEELEY